MENLFCWFFCIEIGVRFMAFEKKRNCAKDNWFKFDACLVTLMVFETWILPMFAVMGHRVEFDSEGLIFLRLLRLLRVSRLIRLIRTIPELVIMVRGMVAALRSVWSTLILLLGFLFVAAMVATSMYKDDELYSSVLKAAMTLFLAGTVFDEILSVTQPRVSVPRDGFMEPTNMFFIIIYAFVVLLAGFTLLNMLIGVVNQVVSDVAEHENLSKKAQDIAHNMSSTYEAERSDEDGTFVTRELFRRMLEHQEFRQALNITGVTVDHYQTVETTLFLQEDLTERKLDFHDEFLSEVAELSPDRKANVMHACDLRLRCRKTISDYRCQMEAKAETIVGTQKRVLDECNKFFQAREKKKHKRFKKVKTAILYGMGAKQLMKYATHTPSS
jgi:hypothetical protein